MMALLVCENECTILSNELRGPLTCLTLIQTCQLCVNWLD